MKKLSSLKYLVASLILAIPLYPKFPFISVPGTYVSIRIEDFIIGLIVLVWFVNILPNLKDFLHNRLTQSFIIFFIVTAVSVFSAVYLTQTAPLGLGVLHWARRVEYMICFFIAMSAVRSKQDLLFYIKCLCLVALYATVYGIGQKYFNLPIVTTQNSEYSKGLALEYISGGHLVSTFAGHYDLANFLLIVLPVLYLLLVSPVAKNIFSKIAIFVTISSGLWLLVNTASRISILSYFVGVSLSLFLFKKARLIPIFVIFSLIFIASSSSLISRYTQVFEVYFQKYINISQVQIVHDASAQGIPSVPKPTNLPSPSPLAPAVEVVEDRSTSIRLNVEWPRAIRAFTKNPLLGTGYSSITLATDNDYLRMLGEVGILGFLSFVLIFLNIGKVFLMNIKKLQGKDLISAYSIGIIGAVVATLINAVFIDVFEASKSAILFWICLGLAVGALKNVKKA